MEPIEIVLILLGIGIIIISSFFVDKHDKKMSSPVESSKLNSVEIDSAEIKNKLSEVIKEVTDETIVNTEDELSKISNEKIIAVNDYSKQVIDKISQNHEEVVFLYNMLNEKESEVKNLLKQVEHSKTAVYEKKVEALSSSKNTTGAKELNYDVNNQFTSAEVNNPGDVAENNNEIILNLYKQGKSILEISKMLEIGQGEVKLVIDLFK